VLRRVELPHPRSGVGFVIVAHRGNKKKCPENSLAAFRLAVDEGADLLETDLRPLADGAFACFHDPILDRMTNGSGSVETLTHADVRKFRLRQGRRIWEKESVPLIGEVAALCPSDVVLALELKSSQFDNPAVCAALLQELARLELLKRVIILSFHQRRLKAWQQVAPDIPIGLVTFFPWPRGSCDFLGPIPPILYANPLYVREAHRKEYIVCPLDSRPEERIRYYQRLGVDALLTDDPAATIAAARSLP
jgi:glycerophosphoryl diester phosphodiesterase